MAELRVSKQFSEKWKGREEIDYYYSGKYEQPPMIAKEISFLKIMMQKYGTGLGISSSGKDINLDRGHAFCRELRGQAGRIFTKQTLESNYERYESAADESNYEALTKLAEEHIPECRITETHAYRSKLCKDSSWTERQIWDPEIDEKEEEIWITINSTVDKKIDKLLEVESNWLKISDFAQLEASIEEASIQYSDQYLSANQSTKGATINNTNSFYAIESLRDTENKMEIVEPKDDQIKNNWQHVIKAFLLERVLLMKECKRKLEFTQNYFCYIKRRLAHDMIEIATKNTSWIPNKEIKIANPQSRHYARGAQIKNKSSTVQLLQRPPPLYHEGSEPPLITKTNYSFIGDSCEKHEAQFIFRVLKIANDEIRLIDSQGIHVFMENALEDSNAKLNELLNVGTYYIRKFEDKEYLFKKGKKSLLDRGQVLLDLLKNECAYQYYKFELIEEWMKIYEQTINLDGIQRVGQVICDLIKKRPRMHLGADYFLGSYKVETKCMQKYKDLLSKLINSQIAEENKYQHKEYKIEKELFLIHHKVFSYEAINDADAESLYEFSCLHEGKNYFLGSLAQIANIILEIQKVKDTFDFQFQAESGFAICAIEHEIITSALEELNNPLELKLEDYLSYFWKISNDPEYNIKSMCNIIESARIHEQIMDLIIEANQLEIVYFKQRELISLEKNIFLESSILEGISINEHNLAVQEFDPTMKLSVTIYKNKRNR